MSRFGQRTRVSTAISAWMPTDDGPPVATSIDFLIVAAGGYGSGGAGGMRSTVTNTGGSVGTLESVFSVSPEVTYTVTVGAGGAGPNSRGYLSSISNAIDANDKVESIGGGNYGTSGGSGGGCAGYAYDSTDIYIPGASGTANQGYAGGGCLYNGSNSQYAGALGAGGGAGGVGGESAAYYGSITRGAGGAGRTNNITGTTVTYAQGGGNGTSGGSRGPNTGDGGNNFQYGNSGIVVLRWSAGFRAASSTTGSPTYSLTDGYHVYQYTGSGSIVF